MKKVQFLSEILGDFLLPLLGFLFWSWDLYFILLYILLDYTIRLLFTFIRPDSRSFQWLLRPVLFYLSFLILSHFYMVLTAPTWRFSSAFSAFFWYEDFFIPQGFIIIPLLIYTETSRQRMELMMTGSYNAVLQTKKLGSRMLSGTIIFMLMSLFLAVFNWSQSAEIIFFLGAWLSLIVLENIAVFLKD